MTPSTFLNGLLAPFYSLFGNGFSPSTNFGQFIIIVIVALSMVSVMINTLFK